MTSVIDTKIKSFQRRNMLNKTNQYLIADKKKKRLLNLSLNFIFPHSNTVHPSSYILTSDKCAFLGIKYVFRKRMLTSLGKNNVAPDPSG